MDLGAALHHSHHLAELSPSTSPLPLGKRNRQFGRTTSHIESHTMGDTKDEITEMYSPPQEVREEDPTPVYDPSPEIPSHSGYDPSFTGRQYWFLGDETHHEPTSTSHVSYGMSDIPAHDLTNHAKLEIEPSTMPGGIPIPFHAERFGSTSHIAPSIPMVEATSHVSPRPSVSSPIRIPKPRQVTIGNTTYITSHVPSSSIPSSSNFIPPHHSRGPSSRNVTTSHVRTDATSIVVS